MYRRNGDIVAAVVIALLGFAAVALRMPGPAVLILGACLFVAPGYVWSEVLLSHSVATLERVLVSVALAFMVPVLGGLALHAAGVSLFRDEWVGLLAAATIVGTAVLAVQRRSPRPLATSKRSQRRLPPVRHVLTFGLAVVIGIGAITLAIAGAEAQKYTAYTQLWLTPHTNGPLQATLGVTNEQGVTMDYRLVLRRKGRVSETWNLALASGGTWQHAVTYTTKYLITADLYRLPDLRHPFRKVDNGG